MRRNLATALEMEGFSVLTAENDLRVANASLTRVAGSATAITASPDDTLETPVTLPTEDELAVLAGDGPAVRLATSNVAVARAAKRSQKSTYLPTLTMSPSARVCSPWIRSPFTFVPFVLPRSSTHTPPSRR
mgnify:CR=1 FL=1